ncbi:DUF3885 domain-containing protein [Kiloniella laminariae]|uniref:DUF3885 domain-containing protein n=1 Tax=Kiloniella laminariae TaxID=454162 RepID=A0ABT4LE50_9PROT|nr:DUF3885 domain-containing protein [Kiloniella laminariae]MCZ4279374.1 DUF3885 domain-containing protein [Kiloniella laminariae]
MKKFVKREQFENIFGEKALAYGLFYKHNIALRFELELPHKGVFHEEFLYAWERAQTIIQRVFDSESRVGVCLALESDKKSTFSIREQIYDLKCTGITIPKGREYWFVLGEEDEGNEYYLYRHFILYDAPCKDLKSLVWISLAKSLGIRPDINGEVYLFDLEKQILAHPYDNRGIDLISPNVDKLNPIYQDLNHLLFDYDREKMDRVFKA